MKTIPQEHEELLKQMLGLQKTDPLPDDARDAYFKAQTVWHRVKEGPVPHDILYYIAVNNCKNWRGILESHPWDNVEPNTEISVYQRLTGRWEYDAYFIEVVREGLQKGNLKIVPHVDPNVTRYVAHKCCRIKGEDPPDVPDGEHYGEFKDKLEFSWDNADKKTRVAVETDQGVKEGTFVCRPKGGPHAGKIRVKLDGVHTGKQYAAFPEEVCVPC